MARAVELYATWNQTVDVAIKPTNANPMSYAQMLGVVNSVAAGDDFVLKVEGGLPCEANKNGRIKSPGIFDCDYGFSCMGYEIAGAWGAAVADPSCDVIAL